MSNIQFPVRAPKETPKRGRHPSSIANLAAPWKPGQSGNPGGRPRNNPVSDYLREQLEAPVPQEMLDALKPQMRTSVELVWGSSPTFGQLVAFRTIQQSMRGDVSALKEVLDRVEGKVPQKQELTGADGGPIDACIAVRFVDADGE